MNIQLSYKCYNDAYVPRFFIYEVKMTVRKQQLQSHVIFISRVLFFPQLLTSEAHTAKQISQNSRATYHPHTTTLIILSRRWFWKQPLCIWAWSTASSCMSEPAECSLPLKCTWLPSSGKQRLFIHWGSLPFFYFCKTQLLKRSHLSAAFSGEVRGSWG